MKNFIQEGEYLDLTAPYAVSSGGGALVGITFGVAVADVADGAVGSFATCGVFTMTKATGAGTGTTTQGAAAYWNDTNKVITAASAGNTKVGVFVATCADGDATCKVRLNGSF